MYEVHYSVCFLFVSCFAKVVFLFFINHVTFYFLFSLFLSSS